MIYNNILIIKLLFLLFLKLASYNINSFYIIIKSINKLKYLYEEKKANIIY
jgi:hypothetical protein